MTMQLTHAQIVAAAEAAVRAMSADAKAAFIAMVEAGQHDAAQAVANGYALEGVSRQLRLGHMLLEDSRKMDRFVSIIADEVIA